MLDKEKFGILINTMAEIYNKELSPLAISLYYEVLKKYEYEEVKKAFHYILKTHKYNTFPVPAKIIEFLEGDIEEKALYAWQTVIDTIKKVGYYGSVEFEDKTIHSVIDALGGWMELCSKTKDDLKFIEKEFIKLYKLFSKYPREIQDKLIGFVEKENRLKGFEEDIPKPVSIKSDIDKTLKQIEKKEEVASA